MLEPKTMISIGIPAKIEDDEVCKYIKNEVNKLDINISDKCNLESKLVKVRGYNQLIGQMDNHSDQYIKLILL